MSGTKQTSMPVEPLKVNIFNQPYHLRTDGDGDYVRQLAQFVDERMQAISMHTSIVDYAKVAVLAALNIADELHRLRLDAETAESNERQQVPADASQADGERTAALTSVESQSESQSRGGDSWSYSDIFESLPSSKEPQQKLGHNITARLRQLRGEGGPAPPAEPEE
jgi:cell division protein ZapA